LLRTVEIGGHTQFIGEIKDTKMDEDLIKDGKTLNREIMPLIFGIDNFSYYGVGKIPWRRLFHRKGN